MNTDRGGLRARGLGGVGATFGKAENRGYNTGLIRICLGMQSLVDGARM